MAVWLQLQENLLQKIKIFDSKYSTNKINFFLKLIKNKWASKITNEWKIGEEFAHEAMSNFLNLVLQTIKKVETFQNKMFQNFLLLFIGDKSSKYIVVEM